jgi:hypothetical protein
LDDVVSPFGYETSKLMIQSSIDTYGANFDSPAVSGHVEDNVDSEFALAWLAEQRAPIDKYRQLVDEIEDYGIKQQTAVLKIRRSDLLDLCSDSAGDTAKIVDILSSRPRPSWRTIPDGFHDKDRRPWRMRRRLSLLRLPIVQIDESTDPVLFIAPGLLRDAVNYVFRNHYHGYFPSSQLATIDMRRWSGKEADRRGSEFSNSVAERLQANGWKTETEVTVTKICRRGFDRDYGDVDVLAWNLEKRRVLAIECKDLHFHKTIGELAEQLRDFRGEIRDGRPDLLRRHLDRCSVLQQNAKAVSDYVEIPDVNEVEKWIVFRNTVPMLVKWNRSDPGVRATTHNNLDKI